MTFQVQTWLWALLALPVLAVALVMWGRSRRSAEARYADPDVLPLGPSPRTKAFRIGAGVLALLAVGAGIVALARPSVDAQEDQRQSSVIVALDLSNSMLKDDLEPSRLDAAVDAAKRFVDEAPDGTRVGVLTFADNIEVVLPPEEDPEIVKNALDNLGETREGTALGEAVVQSLGALSAAGALTPPPESPLTSAGRILVLTDGANSIRKAIPPSEAAARASGLNVPIYTIQLGDDRGRPDQPTPAETLSLMATETGGIYAQTANTEDLRAVFADIGTIIAPVEKLRELTVFAAAASLILVVLAALLAVLARPGPRRSGGTLPT